MKILSLKKMVLASTQVPVLTALALGLAISLSSVAFATEKTPKRVYPNIRFMQAADLPAFNEAYSKTLEEQRSIYVGQAKSLMQAGAMGSEAAKMLMSFDAHILKLRERSKVGLSQSLEARFKAQLDALYRQYQPPVQYLQFTNNKDNGLYEAFIYGSYTIKNQGGRPGILATVTLVDIFTGEEKSYEAYGNETQAASILARMVFDDHQRTTLPTTVKIGRKQLTVLSHFNIELQNGYRNAMKDLYQSALTSCESQNARLITEEDLRALTALGDYRGGITIARNDGQRSYFWAVQGGQVVVSHNGAAMNVLNMNPVSYLNYLCVK